MIEQETIFKGQQIYIWYDEPSQNQTQKQLELKTLQILSSNNHIVRRTTFQEFQKQLYRDSTKQRMIVIASSMKVKEIIEKGILKLNWVHSQIIIYSFTGGKNLQHFKEHIYEVAVNDIELLAAMSNLQNDLKHEQNRDIKKEEAEMNAISKKMDLVEIQEGQMKAESIINPLMVIWIDKYIEGNVYLKAEIETFINIECFSSVAKAIQYFEEIKNSFQVRSIIFANNVASEVLPRLASLPCQQYIIYCGNEANAYRNLKAHNIEEKDPRFYVTQVQNLFLDKIRSYSYVKH